MTGRPDLHSVIRTWVTKAEHDHLNAEHTLQMDPVICPFDTVCFHAQQCIEKYLKALLTFKGIEFSRTHDLWDLCKTLQTSAAVPITKMEAETMSDYAVLTRSTEEELITLDDATAALSIARRVRDWARTQLHSIV